MALFVRREEGACYVKTMEQRLFVRKDEEWDNRAAKSSCLQWKEEGPAIIRATRQMMVLREDENRGG